MLTASNMWRAMSFLKKGGSTEARGQYLMEVVAERMTDIIVPHFVTEDMQWGIYHQREAIAEWEIATGEIAGPEGFFQFPGLDFGGTPDGLIGNDGVLEVKCPRTSTHLSYCSHREIPMNYKWQMCAQLLCSARSHAVFVSYDPRIWDQNARLLIIHFRPDSKMMDEALSGAKRFLQEVDELFQRVTEDKHQWGIYQKETKASGKIVGPEELFQYPAV